MKQSTTDPECGLFHKSEKEKCFAYSAHTACDKNNFVLGFEVTAGNVHDSTAFDGLYDKVTEEHEDIESIVVDAGYKTPAICRKILRDNRNPVMPYKRPMTKKGYFKKYEYIYTKKYDHYICPNKKLLTYSTTNRDGYRLYKSNPKDCKNCPFREKCTQSKNYIKVITRHIWQDYLDAAERLRHTETNKTLYRMRKETIERVFADAKEKHRMRYARYRSKKKVAMEISLIYSCMNLKKLATWMAKDDSKCYDTSDSSSITAIILCFFSNIRKEPLFAVA